MFDNNNYSNENPTEQNNSQTVQSGSGAAHTENNNGQTAGSASGSYSGVNQGGCQNNPGGQYTGGYQNGAGSQGGYQNGTQGPYQAGGYQAGGYQSGGYPGKRCRRTAAWELQRLQQLPVPSGELPVWKQFFG